MQRQNLRGASCTNGWSVDRSINTGAIHGSTFCSRCSAASFWIGPKRRPTRGSDVTLTFIYIFQEGCWTNSLHKIRSMQLLVVAVGLLGSNQKTATIFTPNFSDFSVNGVIVIDKIILLFPLVAILFWIERSSWSKVLNWHLERSTGSVGSFNAAQFWCNALQIRMPWKEKERKLVICDILPPSRLADNSLKAPSSTGKIFCKVFCYFTAFKYSHADINLN